MKFVFVPQNIKPILGDPFKGEESAAGLLDAILGGTAKDKIRNATSFEPAGDALLNLDHVVSVLRQGGYLFEDKPVYTIVLHDRSTLHTTATPQELYQLFNDSY